MNDKLLTYQKTLRKFDFGLFNRRWEHINPRYVVDRVALHYSQKRNPDLPWLTAHSIEILESCLRSTDIGFEWGSGCSTTWFAKRVAQLTSIEHNQEWYKTVARLIAAENVITKVDNLHIGDGLEEREDTCYVRAIERFPDCSIDFCLVDGLARDHCSAACLAKIKLGGLFILDNADCFLPRKTPSRSPNARSTENGFASPVWEEVATRIKNWRCIWTTNGVWDTAVWVKTD